MLQPFAAAIAANRFGLGAKPGDLERIGGDPVGWLDDQLTGSAPVVSGEGLRPSEAVIADSLRLRDQIRAAKQSAAGKEGDAAALQAAVTKLPQFFRPIYTAEATARFQQAIATDRPFVERLTQFWTNHFAVSVDKIAVLGVAGAFEREAIRPHVLGKFTDLLLAVEQHPAMLLYLDNYLSVGPDSMVAAPRSLRPVKRQFGINENLAREILELHTLGVGGGYTQADVTIFAEVITGWSISGEARGIATRRSPAFNAANESIGGERGRMFSSGEPGRFVFRPDIHEPGAKVVLGKRYVDNEHGQGVAVLHDLAAHPSTARFIATKLVRHFIADDPPGAAVDRLAKAFHSSGGDLPTVYRALITCTEAWASPLSKYKTPSDYIVSSFRGLDLPTGNQRAVLAPFEVLGQRTYSPGSPAGWPDKSADWDGASALMKRIEWADAVGQRVGSKRDAAELAPQLLGATLTSATRTAISRAASGAQALTLLLAAPEFMRR
jgi:uncharacterized protein (DUF1800 family)